MVQGLRLRAPGFGCSHPWHSVMFPGLGIYRQNYIGIMAKKVERNRLRFVDPYILKLIAATGSEQDFTAEHGRKHP